MSKKSDEKAREAKDAEKNSSDENKLPENASPTDQNANTNTAAEEHELNRTVDTETGKVIENATESNTEDGDDSTTGSRSSGPPAPGTDNSTAETVRVKTSGDFLFHDPFTATTVDNTDDGGNEDGVIRSAMVQAAIEDGRLEEVGGSKSSKKKDD